MSLGHCPPCSYFYLQHKVREWLEADGWIHCCSWLPQALEVGKTLIWRVGKSDCEALFLLILFNTSGPFLGEEPWWGLGGKAEEARVAWQLSCSLTSSALITWLATHFLLITPFNKKQVALGWIFSGLQRHLDVFIHNPTWSSKCMSGKAPAMGWIILLRNIYFVYHGVLLYLKTGSSKRWLT